MSDERLRELEHRFRETGSADDELAWLRERARLGEKLDWDSYSRLHELDAEAAADYLRWRVETGELGAAELALIQHCVKRRRRGLLRRLFGGGGMAAGLEAWVRGLEPWEDMVMEHLSSDVESVARSLLLPPFHSWSAAAALRGARWGTSADYEVALQALWTDFRRLAYEAATQCA